MGIKEKFLALFNKFEDLFMTSHSCVCCEREIPDGEDIPLCKNCSQGIELIDGEVCAKCGEKLIEGAFCGNCENRNYHFKSNRSASYYTDISTKIVKRFKYGKRRYISVPMAKMMCANTDYFKDVDIVTFVPISKRRLKERGFNQAQDLATNIGKIISKPVIAIFRKIDNGKHQSELSQADRLKNLVGSIEILENNENFKNKTILIVDDVFTTGATLDECSKVALKLKPKIIKTATFAKTKFNSWFKITNSVKIIERWVKLKKS